MSSYDSGHFRSLLRERERMLTDYLSSLGDEHRAEANKITGLLSEIEQAVERVDKGTFGTCTVCKEEVEYDRLEVQPIREICLGCITPEEQTLLEEELAIASKIHRALLPQQVERIAGYDFAVKALAARSVGGDYYDFLRHDRSGRVKVVIADSMGKGIPASLLMSNLQGALRVLAEDIDSPALLVARLNWWLCRNVPVSKFISLACVELQPEAGSTAIRYANAGHCPLLVVRSSGLVESFDSTGGVLGVHADFGYEERAIRLDADDMVVLYTDGVTEAVGVDGSFFDQERLEEYCMGHREEPAGVFVENLLGGIRRFTGKDGLDDDLTVIVLRKK